MKKIILINIYIIFSFSYGFSQKCGFSLIDDFNADKVVYIQVDTTLLNGKEFIMFVEIFNSKKVYHKFENIEKGILYNDSSVGKAKIFKHKVIDFDNINLKNNIKLDIMSGQYSRHIFDMVLIKKKGLFMQIVPTGATIEIRLECIKEFNYPLYEILSKLILIKNKN